MLYLTKANLEIIEKSKIKILQKVDLGGGSAPLSNLLDSFGDNLSTAELTSIRLEPGESYQCIFKMKVAD